MASPREGVLQAIKRVIRHLRRYPRCIIAINSDQKSDRAGERLNSVVKGISEAIGLRELLQEILLVTVTIRIHVDASACKWMLLRHGTGKVKHLTTKQLWVQGAVQAYDIEVLKVPRAENSADI